MNGDQPQIYKTLPVLEELTNMTYDDNHVEITITRNSNPVSITAFMKDSFIRITMDWYSRHSGFLNFKICVPRQLCHAATGHLGSCDGNAVNDIPSLDPNQRE